MNISIAMAVCYGARYLEQQLNSFVAQTRLPEELIVCDDGSTDGSVEIIERFAKHAPFEVTLHRNPTTLGYTQNFGKAIGLCGGDLIFMSDQDDVWLPEKLAVVERIFLDSPSTLVVINDMEITDHELTPSGLTQLDQIHSALLHDEDHTNGCATAMRAELRTLALPIPLHVIGHDDWIHAIAQAFGSRYLLVRTLQWYRRHDHNASNWLSGTTKVKWTERVVHDLVTKTASSGYTLRSRSVEIMLQRLINLGPDGYQRLGGARPFQDVLAALKRESEALYQREALLESGWLKRKILATDMFLQGEYQYFRRWFSFAKDLLR